GSVMVGLFLGVLTGGSGFAVIFPLLIVVGAGELTFLILAALAANRGELYRIPTPAGLPVVRLAGASRSREPLKRAKASGKSGRYGRCAIICASDRATGRGPAWLRRWSGGPESPGSNPGVPTELTFDPGRWADPAELGICPARQGDANVSSSRPPIR